MGPRGNDALVLPSGVLEAVSTLLKHAITETSLFNPHSLHYCEALLRNDSVSLSFIQYLSIKEYRGVLEADMPICVLRPSDIVTISCNHSGDIQNFGILLIGNYGVGRKPDSACTIMELIVASTAKEVFLCSTEAIETVTTLKARISAYWEEKKLI